MCRRATGGPPPPVERPPSEREGESVSSRPPARPSRLRWPMPACSHVDTVRVTELPVPLLGCEECLKTGPIPPPNAGFDVDVDFVDHVVTVRTTAGALERVRLEPKSVADFYAELMAALRRAVVPVEITTTPTEVANRTPYPEDVE